METRDKQGSDRKQNLSPAGSVSCDKSQQRLWRVCNGLIAVFFGLAAYVQKNDPDAELWIALYLIPAFLILLVSVNPYITGHVIWSTLADLHTVICIVCRRIQTIHCCCHFNVSVHSLALYLYRQGDEDIMATALQNSPINITCETIFVLFTTSWICGSTGSTTFRLHGWLWLFEDY
ncbi:transmembrane 220 [Pelobates cultripes]|uniref:Transmembrane 220 n=1 Tax=Pelobates cultripes TaxID=61616 RepID=A0AAD1W4V7_PELCU|nr:transmembrane 220 [Pelobates cultripes]